MAELRFAVAPSDNLERYEMQVDDNLRNIELGTDNEGSATVNGRCGDGSMHRLYYVLVGPVGASLGLKIFCDDTLRTNITLRVYAPGPVQHGDVEFRL
ncbi:MAG TPA: hypothetical protein VFP12_05695 [Allosphingosinicella sp.]|nr:hypothetical protein [Allosphingosinicella sp.]